MIQRVRRDLEEIGTAIKIAIDTVAETELAGAGTSVQLATAAVMGIQPIDPADLLDGSRSRRSDLELILREASRGFYRGRIYPKVRDDDYDMNRYIQVTPFDAYISTSMGRQARPDENASQPWTWLRVHSDTPHAALAYEALEQLAPGHVVADLHGRAIPIVVPDGVLGPKMLEEVHLQIHDALAAIHHAIKSHHPHSSDS